MVSSLRQIPKPGYGLAPRSHTFSSATTTGSTTHGAPVSALSLLSVSVELAGIFQFMFCVRLSCMFIPLILLVVDRFPGLFIFNVKSTVSVNKKALKVAKINMDLY